MKEIRRSFRDQCNIRYKDVHFSVKVNKNYEVNSVVKLAGLHPNGICSLTGISF